MSADLLGKNVVVTLDDTTKIVARGRLLAFDQWGEVVLEDEMGGLHYCWPLLRIEEANPEIEEPT